MTDHQAPSSEPPKEWIDALERGRADIAAARTAPWDEVRARLSDKIDAAEAVQARRQA